MEETCIDCVWFDDISEECTNQKNINDMEGKTRRDIAYLACSYFEPIK